MQPLYCTHDAIAVPRAAPAAPNPNPGTLSTDPDETKGSAWSGRLMVSKMNRGSRIAFKPVNSIAIFNGVT